MNAYFPSVVGNFCYVFPLSVQLQVAGSGGRGMERFAVIREVMLIT